VDELRKKADARLVQLKKSGDKRANIYGYNQAGGLNVFYLLLDRPSVYGLPENPVVPQRKKAVSSGPAGIGILAMGLAAVISFREGGARTESADKEPKEE
jgi:formate dehydrogenase iron-sulfur subunit